MEEAPAGRLLGGCILLLKLRRHEGKYRLSFKVFARLFQKAAQSRARSPRRRPQAAKLSTAFLFCKLFSLRLLRQRKKRLWNLVCFYLYTLTKNFYLSFCRLTIFFVHFLPLGKKRTKETSKGAQTPRL